MVLDLDQRTVEIQEQGPIRCGPWQGVHGATIAVGAAAAKPYGPLAHDGATSAPAQGLHRRWHDRTLPA
jgi:hypothetical protein